MPEHIQHPKDLHAGDQIMYLILGVSYTPMLAVAAQLKIADLLADGPKSAQDLAEATGSHAPSLSRMLRALSSIGVFAEDEEPDHFALTPLAERLRSDVPGNLRDWCIMCGSQWHMHSWAGLAHSVKTGQPAFDEVHGKPIFEHFEEHPDEAEEFNRALTSKAGQDAQAIIDAYDFSGCQTIVDVGGGHGTIVAEILKAHPKLKGIHFDQPSVVEGAGALIESHDVLDRCEVVGGNFFEAVPKGGDLYFLKYIMHDWDDERAGTILRNCRQAMAPKGRLVIVDTVVPEGNGPHLSKLVDGVLLVVTTGKERTEAEFSKLLSDSGFELNRVIDTEFYVSVLEASPV